jgi:hypothetical protein
VFHRRVAIINEDTGLVDHIENRYEEVRRMVAPITETREDIGLFVGREDVDVAAEPVHVFRDGDLAILTRTIYQGQDAYIPAGQAILILTRDPNEASSVWGQDDFIRCSIIGGGEMGILGRCLMPIVYDGDTPQAHELMALFGGTSTLGERQVSG